MEQRSFLMPETLQPQIEDVGKIFQGIGHDFLNRTQLRI